MKRHGAPLLIALALAAAVTPAWGQDVSTMSASEYMNADEAKQYTVIGYVIGRYQMVTEGEAKAVGECVEKWLARPSNDGLWGLTELQYEAAMLAAFGSESTMPVGEVFERALWAKCG